MPDETLGVGERSGEPGHRLWPGRRMQRALVPLWWSLQQSPETFQVALFYIVLCMTASTRSLQTPWEQVGSIFIFLSHLMESSKVLGGIESTILRSAFERHRTL